MLYSFLWISLKSSMFQTTYLELQSILWEMCLSLIVITSCWQSYPTNQWVACIVMVRSSGGRLPTRTNDKNVKKMATPMHHW